MDNTLLINWKKDTMDEFVFPSNTSIISKHLIEKEMAKVGLLDEKAHERCKTLNYNVGIKKVTKSETQKKVLKICDEASKSKNKKKEILQKIKSISKDYRKEEKLWFKKRNTQPSVVLDPENIDFYSLNDHE